MEILLFEPRIPQNTGSIARTCAAFDITLNLIEPLGFKLEDKYLKRAGLDYWPLVKLEIYPNFNNFKNSKKQKNLALAKKMEYICKLFFNEDDILLFGREDMVYLIT